MLPNSPSKSAVRLFLLLALGTIASNPSIADTIYVNNIGGDDANNGATSQNKGDGIGPLRTLTGALSRVQRGDSIELANTDLPYNECVTLQGRRHSGTSFAPFVIEGNGATLEGIAEVPSHRWDHVGGNVYRYAPRHAGYQQLFLDDEPAELVGRFDGFYDTRFLKAKQWCRCKGGIHFASEKNKSVHNYELAYASHPVGITLYEVENVVIRNLKVRGFQLDGINAHDNAFDCVLSDVTSFENGRSGVSVGGSSRVRLVNCELQGNNDTQLNAEGWSTSTLQNSKLSSKVASLWKRELNSFGRGARVIIDGKPQIEQQAWASGDEDEKKLEEEKEGTEETEGSVEKDSKPNPKLLELDTDEQPEEASDDLNDIFDGLDDEVAETDEEAAEVADAQDNDTSDPFAEEGDGDPALEEGDVDLFDDGGDGDLFDDPGDSSTDDDDPFGDF